MSAFQGFGELRHARDLVEKLRFDLARIESCQFNQYAAFDFFVTAEHIVDWLYPNDQSQRTLLRNSEPLLGIVSHIANGAKHFATTNYRHKSVAGIEKDRYVEAGYVEEGYFEDMLLVHLAPDEAKRIGVSSIDARSLARQVLEFWEART